MGTDHDELAVLQRRAYGPDASIDGAGRARLAKLQAQVPAPSAVTIATAPSTAATTTTSPDSPSRHPLLVWRLLWATSLIASAAVGALAVSLIPDPRAPAALLLVDPDAAVPDVLRESLLQDFVDEDLQFTVYDDYRSALPVLVRSGDATCLVVFTGEARSSGWDQDCSFGGLLPVVDWPLDELSGSDEARFEMTPQGIEVRLSDSL